MLYEHPQLAMTTCKECQEFVYNIPDGTPELMEDGERVPRPPGAETPCDRCPRGGPENEELFSLSAKNVQTLRLYRRFKTGLTRLPARLETCPVLADNFAIIDEVVRDSTTRLRNRELAAQIAIQLARLR